LSGQYFAGAILLAASLGACSMFPDDKRPPDVIDQVKAIDLLPRQPAPVAAPAAIPDNRQAAEYYAPGAPAVGDRTGTIAASQSSAAGGSEGYDLNFENAPLTTVAKVVLGDIMGVGYTIDPRVEGTISLASARPVPKADMLYVLESALRTSNAAMIRDAVGYRLVPIAEAVGSGNADVGVARAEPGYGLSVVPLRYVSAQTLMPLLDSFATKTGAVRADPGRNILLIQGSGAERRAAIDTVLKFDADWMRGQSVGVYPVRNSAPEPLVAELENVMDAGEGGLSHNLVKFQVVSRLNAILVVTRKPELLRTAATWISRLDRADTTTGVRVYNVRYGDAKQLAKVLNELFMGGSSTGLDQTSSQIAPGSGVSVSSSSDSGSDNASSGGGLSTAQRLGVSPAGSTSGGGAKSTASDMDAPPPAGPQGSAGALLPSVRITADTVNNTLLIYASQEHYRIIERTLVQLDRQQLQVAIEATVAEVTLNDTLNYGVQFYLTSQDLGLGKNNGSIVNTLSSAIADAAINQVLPGFNLLVGPEGQPKFILDALHAVTDVKVLSNPSLVVVDNQPATLQVGDEVPVSTGSATVLTGNNTVVNTIEYKNTGIILRVVPRVNVNGQVRLDIEQEISNVSTEATGGSSGGGGNGSSNSSSTLTPTVSQRKVKSTIAVMSGQTVLLAGLISERHNGVRTGIPILDQLPGVGDLFAHTNHTVRRTELIIFIRPQIIRDSFDAHAASEELRAKLRGAIGSPPGGPVPPRFN
jgi:general secretion pathway protein D